MPKLGMLAAIIPDMVVELFKDHKMVVLALIVAFATGAFVQDYRTSERASEEAVQKVEEDIRGFEQSLRNVVRNQRQLSRQQERILCRLDGRSSEECDITTRDINPVFPNSNIRENVNIGEFFDAQGEIGWVLIENSETL